MKNVQLLMFLVAFIGSSALFTACGSHSHDHGDDTEQQGKEYTSAYICPMNCSGSGSEEPGTCPVCKMDYVKNENAKEEGHSHDDHEGHDHDGHDHSDHDGHNH
ncbi:heavy metal-binding domain-containing protein [Lewinella cohaerens]|uniref:heavy metal-binding domain-containing protein n=1 Tax=Lewinella cohaerens TaxID=70995 RepID=UPI0003694CED|nr:heavy metal-binding domain-containing protein [Lewinella cohaerens]